MLQREGPTLNHLDVVAHFGAAVVHSPAPAAGVGTTTATNTTTAPYDPHVASSDLSTIRGRTDQIANRTLVGT